MASKSAKLLPSQRRILEIEVETWGAIDLNILIVILPTSTADTMT